MATAQVAVPSFERCEPGSINIAVADFPSTTNREPSSPNDVATKVIDNVNKYIQAEDVKGLVDLFDANCYWRDHLALSWDFHTLKGHAKVSDFFLDGLRGLKKLTIDGSSGFRAPHYGPLDGSGDVKGVEFFVDFETEIGLGQGLCRLVERNTDNWKIFSLFTSLKNIKGHEENLRHRRPQGVEHGEQTKRKNWHDRRISEFNYEDGAEPTVLILGAGQGGLTAAARLKALGVNALIIDRNQRVGDNWRLRYYGLTLHDPVWYDHLPYLPYPEMWPIFTPKDKLAEWFEIYAKTLELNVWMQTNIVSSSWDESSKQWTVEVERTKPDTGEKETRTFHPKHVIQATGHSGKKNFPTIPGMSDFAGDRLCHSSEFKGAHPDSRGKKAVVVGSCNSGHDIAQTFYECGYDVTMVQRSSTCVISSAAITDIGLKGLYDEDGPPVEDADLWLHGTPISVLKAIQVKTTALQAEHDAKTLEGLEKAGFKLDRGPDMAGLFMKYFQRGGGYYIDVGASQLIIDGKIKMKQGQEIEKVTAHGLKFADGTELEADEVIFATGYQNMRTEARSIFGDEVADRVGDIWGFDEEGEMRTIWRPTGHPGFWFMGGNLALCRYFSRLLALQIKAREVGLVP